ncbi:MAG TPA: nickel pincer cofactor biosynthesis protein LarC [Candidatus Acidoferrales bacterium]|nr:nickel pincer cofactor biosynthesis protein LarC [Candidatus Acidoferrales bacterium]
MKAAYFDCFSGISGDMVLGALVDAGVELERLEAELRRLPLEGWKISAEKVRRGAVTGTKVNVQTHEHHPHRSLAEILNLIEQAGLEARAGARARAIFQRLGEAEAKVHGISVDRVHFHEVGAVDAIIDIVGAAAGFELLGVEDFAVSPLNLGAGSVQTAHGMLPVPAPATAELVRGLACYSSGIERELVTPTGAAIVSTLVNRSGPMPPMTVKAVGWGAGAADLAQQPNLLRLFLGERATSEAGWNETIAVIEANVDDMNPQLYGYFAERAMEAGALDVFSTPAQMKKNRPGQLVTVLAKPEAVEGLVELLFRETTTLGVRVSEARRRSLEREWVTVETAFGPVRMKLARVNGRVLNAAPEYEDCQQIAARKGVPLKQVLAEAMYGYRRQTDSDSRS